MHTQINRILEHLSKAELLDEIHDEKVVSKEEQDFVINSLRDVAHFVIDPRIVSLAAQEKVENSIKDMIAAGIRALPFDPILLEFNDLQIVGDEARTFVRMQTQPIVPTSIEADIYTYVYCMMKREDGGYMVLSLRPGVPIPINYHDVMGFTAGLYHGGDRSEIKAYEHLGMSSVAAMLIAMLMLNTRGVITEHVSMHKLNKARAKLGKPKLNDYSIVRIGHIYDQSGNMHSAEHSGRHMPVHWRSAHVRHVRYGPRNEPAKHRPVLIPAVLVNYDPATDDAKPIPHKEVTM